MYIVTPSQMKCAEEYAVEQGISWTGLMENAGRSAAEEILRRHPEVKQGKVLVLCGKGNNGGDGYVISRLLAKSGATVTAAVMTREPSGTAGEMFKLLDGMENVRLIDIYNIDTNEEYTLIADAVFGTGFHGEIKDELADILAELDNKKTVKMAVDIPSGADSVSGMVCRGTLRCDFTVTFGAVKAGMLLPPAREYCGEIITADIGIDDSCFKRLGRVPVLMTEEIARKALPERNCFSHKGKFGRLLIIAGSDCMSGAAALNSMGALRSGAGLVKLASVRSVIDRVGSRIYEITLLPLEQTDKGTISYTGIDSILEAAKACNVIAFGSGMGHCADTEKLLRDIAVFCGEADIPLIIDADGLNCLADCINISKEDSSDIILTNDKCNFLKNAKCRAVLTPHPGELARLTGTDTTYILSHRLDAAVMLSEMTGAVVAAKGYPTYIVSPDGRTSASYTGNGGLSRGGSGDVLTGVISGICASAGGQDLFESVCSGVYYFGKAADIAAQKLSETGMLPSDAAAQLPFAYK